MMSNSHDMSSNDAGAEPTPSPRAGDIAGNLGPPILLSKVQIAGIAAEPTRRGDIPKIWSRLGITSDEASFHKIVSNLARLIVGYAQEAKVAIDLERAKTILLVIKPDETAELWLDTAAVAIKVMAKRNMQAGDLLYENDIVDIGAMGFPAVAIGAEDKMICLFREGWRFALLLDFNFGRSFSKDQFENDLGALLRNLKYRHIYDAIGNKDVFDRLMKAGWFPFAEIITHEFGELAATCEAGFELDDVEQKVIAAFDQTRLDRMLARWLAKPHFASRELLLRSAIKNFAADDPVAVIKIVLTEIEGVLREAYQAAHGKSAKLDKLLPFALESAERKSGSPSSLLLPAAFAAYLSERAFANFNPDQGLGDASSRHAVGHGMAAADTYTKRGALQALLTLDQLAFSL